MNFDAFVMAVPLWTFVLRKAVYFEGFRIIFKEISHESHSHLWPRKVVVTRSREQMKFLKWEYGS